MMTHFAIHGECGEGGRVERGGSGPERLSGRARRGFWWVGPFFENQ